MPDHQAQLRRQRDVSCACVQIERANQEVKEREAEAEKKLAEAKEALDEAARREVGAELQRLDKQLSARKLDAKELQVRVPLFSCP